MPTEITFLSASCGTVAAMSSLAASTTRHVTTALASLLIALAACSKKNDAPAKTEPATAPVAAEPEPQAPKPQAPKPAEESPGEAQAASAKSALVGHRAPAAKAKLVDGGELNLADLLGKKPVYLKFWATWCVPCREQMPHFEATHKKYGDRIAVIAVDLGLNDSLEAVKKFRTTYPMTMPIAFDDDGHLAEAFHVSVTPQHILIDRTGVVRYLGHATNDALDQAIEALLTDSPGAAAPPADAANQPVAAADEPLPELPIVDGENGAKLSFASFSGAPFALTFISDWCGTYLAEDRPEARPEMAKACLAHDAAAQAQRAKHPSLRWLVIDSPVWTDASSVRDYKKTYSITAPVAIDSTSAWFRRFHVRDVSTTLLFDATGKEVARIGGDGAGLEAALAKLAKK